jgi:uncharacterized protein (TIGR03083 family)
MSEWDATTFDAKDNLLGVVRRQADEFLTLAAAPDAWEARTACPEWQVRDLVGHLIDVTESYFVGFEAARGGGTVPDALGTRAMQGMLDAGAKAHRELGQEKAVARLREDLTRFMGMCDELTAEEWGGLVVPHKYMGPLPAFFYPVFQLMDYGVHSWDIRQGTGRAHGLRAEVADLLVPFMFILWQATTSGPPAGAPACEIGIQVLGGHNAGAWLVSAGPDGFTYAPSSGPYATSLDFDPGSFVLTAFGRSNSGTIRGDAAVAEQYLNMFFRI